MTLKRLTQCTALWGCLFLAGTAVYGQGLMGDLQLFAPPRLDAFGGGRQASQGFFFTYDQLYWWIHAPEGGVASTAQEPGDSLDFRWENSWGERFEMGWMGEQDGIMVSIFNLQHQSQYFTFPSFDIIMANPEEGLPFLAEFSNFNARYQVKTWGVELDYLRRSHQYRRGGYLEFLGGVRYLELNDFLECQGDGGDAFGESTWRTDVENHILGPQLGVRYFKLAGRWMLNAEGRFTAGFNFQNLHLNFVPDPEATYGYLTGHQAVYQNEWCPIAEIRLELRYLITKAINLRVGWTGAWMDGVARAGSINYAFYSESAVMKIDPRNNREDAFIHGLTFGVDINR